MEIEFKDFMDLSKRQGKVLIIGDEGAGKTLLSSYIGIQKMLRGQEDCWKSYKIVDEYNRLGYHFSKNYVHLVFSNFDINCSGTYIPSRKSYVVDPFKVSLYIEDYDTYVFPPLTFFIFTEAQSIFNAYMWSSIRPEIRRYWETSRQADIECLLDTNQPNLIYKGVRELCNRVIYLYKKTEEIKDKDGIVIGHKMYVKEFKKYQQFEKYMETNKSELIEKEYVLILRKCCYLNFDSKQCRYLHLKGRENQDYKIENFKEIKTINDVNEFVENFGVVAKEGYYLTSTKNKKEVKYIEEEL